jgi:uncharacterized membrane protein
MSRERKEITEVSGLGWRVSLSIVTAIGWLIFLILWFFFYAPVFNLYQNIAIFFLSVAVLGVIEGFTWVPMWWQPKTPRYGRGVALSIVVGLAVIVFAFIWLFFYAVSYTLYENIAILVIPGAIYGLTQTVVSRRWMTAEKPEPGWKVAIGAIIGLGWAVFLYIWFSSYAAGYTFFENVVIFFVSAAVMGVFQGVVHAPWRAEIQEQGMGWRVAVSAVMSVGWLVFVIVWFFFLSVGFTTYQNIAIVLISILILGAVMGVTWAPWAIKHAHKKSR